MTDTSIPQQSYAAPITTSDDAGQYVQTTPVWVVVVRGLQVLISFIIVIMAGVLIHGYAMGANGFAVACSIFTWIVVSYVLITEKVSSARKGYNIWAVLSLDLLMALFWLASLGANAQLRARFNTPVQIESCFNDGSAVSSNHCIISGRSELAKRAAVAGETGLALMSAVAGVSAVLWLLFLATLIFHGHTYRLWRQEHKSSPADNATVEMKAQGTPMLVPQSQPAPGAPQYTDQQQYQSHVYPPSQYPHDPSAYAQQGSYSGLNEQQQQQQPQGQPYGVYPDPNQYHNQ
ncbi:uncharacterized protein C8A04DRAFT_24592 [Dichotomopilus funicola]|uniref:MARVEL domain-containing protein n=1 Tax=Dichotomopilus funicola TaxID=1934379 RepID=A0AAN6ZSD3_9PEZI|nr:hypothetical protein C8A04DRAFT_24592 [Dichotomopilus funicola]